MDENDYEMDKQIVKDPKHTPAGIGIPIEIACNYELTQTEKLLFGYIQNLSKSSKGCWASNKYLSKVVGVGDQSITNSLRTLQDYQYIIVEIEKTSKGTERRIFVNPSYLTIYKPLVETFYDNLNQLDAEPLLEKLYATIKRIMTHHKKNYDIKEYIKENVKETASKEADGSTEPSLESLISFDNLRQIKISPYKNLKKGVEELFDYWNSLKDPIPHHEEKKSKTFIKSLDGLDLLLKRGYSKDEIKQSMLNYEWLLTSVEGFKLNRITYGTVVALPEFIEFSKFAIDRIRSGNKDIIKNKVTSWFEECLNTREILEVRWSKLVKDEYPKETQKLKELWREFGGRKLQGADDENIMRRIAAKAYNYFENLNGKYQWGLTERYPIARLHHLFDAGQAEGWDWSKAQPTFLLSQKMFTEKLPVHWERIALADTTTSASMRSKMDNDNKELMEVNSHFSWDENSTREKTLATIAAQRTNKKEEAEEDLEDY